MGTFWSTFWEPLWRCREGKRFILEASIREYIIYNNVSDVRETCICGQHCCEMCHGPSIRDDCDEIQRDKEWRLKRLQTKLNSPPRSIVSALHKSSPPSGPARSPFFGAVGETPHSPEQQGIDDSAEYPQEGTAKSEADGEQEKTMAREGSCHAGLSLSSLLSLANSSITSMTDLMAGDKDCSGELKRRVPSVVDLTTFGGNNYWRTSLRSNSQERSQSING